MPSVLVRRLRRGDLELAVVFDYPAAGSSTPGSPSPRL
jgi:hypothetical protein